MRAAIVILNWNASDRTIDCILKIKKWKHLSPEIIVVDNDSEENDKNNLRRYSDGVHLIENRKNYGYSEGCNIGICYALKMNAEAVLLLNNDAYISEEDYDKLLVRMKEGLDIAVIGPLLLEKDSNKVINAGGQDIGLHYCTHLKEVKNKRTIYDVDYVSGTVMLIHSDVLNTVGMLDKRYFFSGEIADFCKRIQKSKKNKEGRYRIVIEPTAKAYHDIHASSENRETLYTYYTVRNRYLYVRKFYMKFSPVLFLFWSYKHLGHAFHCLRMKRMDISRIILKGMLDGYRGRVGRLNECVQ